MAAATAGGKPRASIVSVEHPCIVRNFDRAFASLGGEAQLKHVLDHRVGDSHVKFSDKSNVLPEPVAGVSLRPNDPLAKKIASVGVETRNVLVKITLPRRTGRKRKRGSDDPFVQHPDPRGKANNPTAVELLGRLRDHETSYTVEPVGLIPETHRFRSMPDFQIRNSELPIMRELRRHVLTPTYDALQNFYVDMKPGSADIPAFPAPPSFVQAMEQPYSYGYEQASGITFRTDKEGNQITENVTAPPKRVVHAIVTDAPEVPTSVPSGLQPRSQLGGLLLRCIDAIAKLLEERPVASRRVIANALPTFSESMIKEASQWVGYSFSAGPWRDLLIRYGVDPRTDPKYRFHQTLMFQLDKEWLQISGQKGRSIRHRARENQDRNGHIFDGRRADSSGKTWQVCDVTDPLLHRLFHTEDIRTECEIHQWGWYHAGTLAKARVIMRDKMRYLFRSEPVPPDDDYLAIASLPAKFTQDTMAAFSLEIEQNNRHVAEMGHDVRNQTRQYDMLRRQKGLPALDDEGEVEIEDGPGDFQEMREDEEAEEQQQRQQQEQEGPG